MSFKFKRVFAVIMRHFLAIIRPFELTTQLYWIGLDIVIFGFLTKASGGLDNITLLTKLSFWHVTSRSSLEMALTFIRDLEDACFVGLVASPIRLYEWVFSQIIIGLFSAMTNFMMGVICIKLLFGLNIFSIGFTVIGPSIGSLIISSWIFGIFLTSFSMYFGKKATSSIFGIAWILVPFSGVFYSINLLPKLCQNIAHWIPMYHVFEALTQFIKGETDITPAIVTSLTLNAAYFVVAVIILISVFRMRKRSGLTRLEVEG